MECLKRCQEAKVGRCIRLPLKAFPGHLRQRITQKTKGRRDKRIETNGGCLRNASFVKISYVCNFLFL